MTTREERERRRAERLEAEKREASAERRRLMLGYVVAGALGLAVVVGIFLVISGGDDSGDRRGERLPGRGSHRAAPGSVQRLRAGRPRGHPAAGGRAGRPRDRGAGGELRAADPTCPTRATPTSRTRRTSPEYKTNPPTSGNHNAASSRPTAPTPSAAEPCYAVHSLEHGRVEIQYSPDLPEKDQLALKGVFDEAPDGMLFFPNPDMPYEVAVTAWTQLMGCDTYEGDATLDAIRDFRATYRGRGPENVPIQLG